MLGVCSWSLRPASPADLVARVREAGLAAVQLALDPILEGAWSEIETLGRLEGAGIAIASGMIGFAGEDYTTLESIKLTGGVRPDDRWPANLAHAKRAASLAHRLGLRLVTLHAGFIPHDDSDPLHGRMIGRLREVVDAFDARGIRVAFETGQESAATLLHALADLDRPHVGVNFDPANMILYGMGDPVAALRALLPRVVQVHIKDARPSPEPGQWGSEVVSGTGAVDWRGFFAALRDGGIRPGMMIEREAGESRVADVSAARVMVQGMIQGTGA